MIIEIGPRLSITLAIAFVSAALVALFVLDMGCGG